MVMARTPSPSSSAERAPAGKAATRSWSKRAKARSRSGASKSTTSISMGPSDLVWSWKLPSNFSEAPSNTVTAAASPPLRSQWTSCLCGLQTPGQDALLGMQAVLGFVEDDRARTVDHIVGHLFPAVGGQAMHEDRVLSCSGHQ